MLGRFLFALFLCMAALYGNPWVMFSDGQDTYIYNQKSGEVYVRFHKGGANYEDLFIKMPQGVKSPKGEFLKNGDPTMGNPKDTIPSKPAQGEQQELLKRALELQNGIYTQGNEP
ncbi:MAG: hypothetical protein ACTTH5_08720 [Wolinella sp.]